MLNMLVVSICNGSTNSICDFVVVWRYQYLHFYEAIRRFVKMRFALGLSETMYSEAKRLEGASTRTKLRTASRYPRMVYEFSR